ncbi:hypothetical protein SAMN04487906_0822 [Zhouia amylolytica]|uniref:Uncharacterized protein n=1 Tax=Zhouia amylolytica TaxID=376730 RepID=A0A1I6QS47_9FLAO|nr:hypothetical protein [Zhouia amylolytica]SFS55199.1 hypothetical protein SAMN04487906_0822 [Zhouia amylolytica]
MQLFIVLTGYYYRDIGLYDKIKSELELFNNEVTFSLYILSHKPKEEISIEMLNYLEINNWKIIYEPNIGWDWGCHVQFIQWFLKQNLTNPDYILFLHDDIQILKNGFINAFLNKVQVGYELIGNSKPFSEINSYLEEYNDEVAILAKNGFELNLSRIEIVRGSAFFISFDLARKSLYRLPYQKCGDINLANRSLRMFGAITTTLVGNNKISHLSNDHFTSEFISEEMRGKKISNLFFLKRRIFLIASKLFQILDVVLSKQVLKHNYSSKEPIKLKVNVSEDKLIEGYLNICPSKRNCSDINLEDLDDLFLKDKIFRLLVSFDLVKNKNFFQNQILDRVKLTSIPVDIIIDSERVTKNEINTFIKENSQLNLTREKSPIKKGTKWINRIYFNYQ